LDDGHVAFFVADVAGHGVSASLLSVMLSRVLSSGADGDSVLVRRQTGSRSPEPVPPGEVVRNLNERFPWNPEAMEYFTLFYGVLHCHTRSLSYVCAGHPRPVLVPARGAPRFLQSDPPAVGLLPGATYVEHELALEPGDRLYAFTDGLLETLSPTDEEFGEARLSEAAESARLLSLSASTQAIIDVVDAWRRGSHPADDQCVLGLEIT
jgi:sigma-B regulation protein RsbU (phosphoserine phosphatase)